VNELFFNKILWTDVAYFTHKSVQRPQQAPLGTEYSSFCLRTCVLSLYGHHRLICKRQGQCRESLSTDRLNILRYCDFLKPVLPWQLEDVHLAMRQWLWLQHDVAPAQYVEEIRQCLNATYPGRQVGLED
jgi:hypothetical protein